MCCHCKVIPYFSTSRCSPSANSSAVSGGRHIPVQLPALIDLVMMTMVMKECMVAVVTKDFDDHHTMLMLIMVI